jgi:phosphate starvation-inducible protein PhoH
MTKKNVKKELEILKSDFSELMDLFDNSHENLSLISKRYSEIKVQVNERLNFLEKEYKANKLNEIELCFYCQLSERSVCTVQLKLTQKTLNS